MEVVGDRFPALHSPAISVNSSGWNSDAVRITEVKSWLSSQFEAAGREVPEFEYTPRSVSQLHALATLSQSRSRAASIVAADLRLKAAEYRAQAARIREVLDSAGLSQERLTPDAVSSVQVVASVANLLNIRDTESSSFIVSMGDLSLRKAEVDEKRAKVQKDSKALLEYTRKAIARLNDLKKTFIKFDNEIDVHEAQAEHWQRNMAIMDSKERQYILQLNNYKALLSRVGYTSEINHGVLMEMAEHKKDLEKMTKPILDTLRSYQDLPPDKALAALAIEDKKRQYAAAEKYLEEVLHSALTVPEL
ncbi:AUGMIN subunit 1 [Phalaenopsis equestris]|uniref:AUGMIN subunit 1 n=1 Tax=Phalaenopsis equestris TaxID=78828 RepID=UPI0009E3A6B2|nr:AUGMIN subunit 1 [Phalaenopsis equestris]